MNCSKPLNKMYLWNTFPSGDSMILGSPSNRLITLACSERSLRLAFKHVLHQNISQLEGFLLGSMTIAEDGVRYDVTLDRFDPGRLALGSFEPCVVIPTDLVVPVCFVRKQSMSQTANSQARSKQHFVDAFTVLRNTVINAPCDTSSQSLVLSLRCVFDTDVCDDDLANVEFYWSSIFISTALQITPVKDVPIIPTALAKTLASSTDLLHEDSLKIGYMTMDQTRKLLLMLDSDPKIYDVSVVGMWISYVSNLYHPAFWLACLHFISTQTKFKRIFSDSEEFLLVVYPTTNSKPHFYKCSAQQFDELSFDFVTCQHFLTVNKQLSQSNKIINVTIDYSPDEDSLERMEFNEAWKDFCKKYRKEKSEKPKKTTRNISSASNRESRTKKSSSLNNNSPKDVVAEICPSLLPTPISKSVPLPPATLEPSLYFSESRATGGGRVPVITPPASMGASYQMDELVPSFYKSLSTSGAAPPSALPPPVASSRPSLLQITQEQFANNQLNVKPPIHSILFQRKSSDSNKKQSWLESLSLDALKHFVEQEEAIEALKDEISRLRAQLMKGSAGTEEREVQSGQVEDRGVQVSWCQGLKRDVGVNTDAIVDDVNPDDISSAANDSLTDQMDKRSKEDSSLSVVKLDEKCSQVQKETHSASNNSNLTTPRAGESNFSSIRLNSSALPSNEPSLMSSLRAVDLPGLESSASTPANQRKLFSESSPVLGESASMYLQQDGDDHEFFGNLLKQVQEMLKKSEEEETEENRSLDARKHDRALPVPSLPHLACLSRLNDYSMMMKSSHELSVHANAIAMKYLSDQQLAALASHSGTQLSSQAAIAISSEHSVVDERAVGVDLLSPANMSVATRKYMQKYGLVASLHEDKENIFPNGEFLSNATSLGGRHEIAEQIASSSLVEIHERDEHSESPSEEVEDPFCGGTNAAANQNPGSDVISTPGWSQLKDNLGDTFDMLLPFLSDLGRNEQSAIKDQSFRSEKLLSRSKDSEVGETVEQILSPRILKTLKRANRKLLQDKSSRKPGQLSAPNSLHKKQASGGVSDQSHRSSMPPPGRVRSLVSSRGRASSVDRAPHPHWEVSEEHRRMSSSPARSKPKQRKPSFDRVLDSHVMQAFNRDLVTSQATEGSNEVERRSSSEGSGEEGNILNMNRIKQLTKLT